MSEEIHYPYIIFKLAGASYCVNSKYIATLVQLPEYNKIPASPPNVLGMFYFRGQAVQLLDLRSTFGMPTMQEEYLEFESMIEQRKQDHIHWVDELERSSLAGEPFTLATDPHQCAFGKWYDNFKTDNNAVLYHLHKIDEPHQKLHAAAGEMSACSQECDKCRRDECLKAILERVKKESMTHILTLLDETKAIFRSSVYREMLLVLDHTQWSMVVDEVVAVEDLEIIGRGEDRPDLGDSSYILNIARSEKRPEMILELNVDAIIQRMEA